MSSRQSLNFSSIIWKSKYCFSSNFFLQADCFREVCPHIELRHETSQAFKIADMSSQSSPKPRCIHFSCSSHYAVQMPWCCWGKLKKYLSAQPIWDRQGYQHRTRYAALSYLIQFLVAEKLSEASLWGEAQSRSFSSRKLLPLILMQVLSNRTTLEMPHQK